MKAIRNHLLVAAAAVVALAGISASQAGIIYQDNFARTGNLAGSTPAPTDATASTWAVSEQSTFATAPTTNGSAADFAAVNYVQAAYLPFTPQANATYAFTLTITPTAGTSANWLAMGFGNTAATVGSPGSINNNGTEAWLIYRDNGGTQSFYGGATNSAASGSYASAGGISDTFTITLTTPADLSTGSAGITFYDSLGLIGSSLSPRTGSLTAAELANVDSIIIGNQYIGGTFAGLELGGPVPEPGTWGLLVMGGGGLLLMGRRCRIV